MRSNVLKMPQYQPCNNLTPMGTIPISVIYGFEYPLNGFNPKIKTRERDLKILVKKKENYSIEKDECFGQSLIVRKTKGCLTDLLKYRKPNFVSSRTSSPVFKLSPPGSDNICLKSKYYFNKCISIQICRYGF